MLMVVVKMVLDAGSIVLSSKKIGDSPGAAVAFSRY